MNCRTAAGRCDPRHYASQTTQSVRRPEKVEQWGRERRALGLARDVSGWDWLRDSEGHRRQSGRVSAWTRAFVVTVRAGVILLRAARRLILRRWAISAIVVRHWRTGHSRVHAVGSAGETRHRVRDWAHHHLHDDEEPRAPGGGLAVHAAHRVETLWPRHQRWCVPVAGRVRTCMSYGPHAAIRSSLDRIRATWLETGP